MSDPKMGLQTGNPAHGDISSHSLDCILSSPEGIGAEDLRSFARDLVRAVATGCEAAGAKDVSHVKLFIEHSSGFLHASAVSGNAVISVAGRDGTAARQFRLVLNAVIFGLPVERIRAEAERALEILKRQYALQRDAESGNEQAAR